MKIATLCMSVALALGASVGAQARTPAATTQPLGVVTSVVETTVRQNPDGSVVTTVRPVKDLAGFFADMGISVPIAPASSICLPPVTVIGDPGDGGSGSDGYHNKPVPPGQDAATVEGMNPPQTVSSDPNVTTFSETTSFNDGWTAAITWGRNSPSDPWFKTDVKWTPPNHGSSAGSTTQGDGDENPE